MKTYKFYLFFFALTFVWILPCFGQEAGYPPIERDEAFEPYVRFEEETDRYFIGHLRDAETGEVFEAIYEPPTKIIPILVVSMEFNNSYNYLFSLVNSSDSRQGIMSITLPIKNQFQEINFPDPWYYREFRSEPLIRVVNRVTEVPERNENEPIFFESDLSINDTLEFEIKSKYPPSIIESFVRGRPTVRNFSFVLAPIQEVERMIDSLRTQVEGADDRGVLVKTIGPRAIPENTTNTELADTLTSYLTQSCDLGWIENQGICRSLQANLDNVKRQIEQGRTQTAANNLQAFLNEVEAIREEHLSSEAYALLKYNGEYLLKKLREE